MPPSSTPPVLPSFDPPPGSTGEAAPEQSSRRRAADRSRFDDFKLWKKLALIALLASLPGAVLAYLLVAEKDIAIDFASREMAGNEFVRPLREILDSAARAALPGADRATHVEHAARELSELHEVAANRGTEVTGGRIEEFAALGSRFQVLAGASETSAPAAAASAVAYAREKIAKIGDSSNLTLDSHLDSYYLMTATVVLLPALHDLLSQAAVLGAMEGEQATLLAQAARRAALAAKISVARDNLRELRRGINVAYANDEDGGLRATIESTVEKATSRTEDLLSLLDARNHEAGRANTDFFDAATTEPAVTGAPATPAAILAAATTALDANRALWAQATDRLDGLLQRRIGALRGRKVVALSGVALTMLVCTLLVIGISSRLNWRVKRLASAAHFIVDAAGHEEGLERQIARMVSRDEIGDLAGALSHVAGRLHRHIGDLQRARDQLGEANATLEHKVEERTALLRSSNAELGAAIDQLRQTKDQLIVQEKMASLGSLTAGIAHEIKNPLNFINNFAELTGDLAGELRGVLDSQQDKLDELAREDVTALMDDIEQNVRKINEHGRRADSIVRGMLQHSRGKSGEFQPTDLNALLAEYTNLAYHGLRAQDPTFNVAIDQKLDTGVGRIDAVPQDLSRVFLNIVNNACYAADQKRRSLPAGDAFQPTLSVSSHDSGNGSVEVRIRDNGAGIPDDIRAKIFEPFFTTKPTGAGTGLGLSMSYDIVVQVHGGTLQVLTEPGEFTEFVMTIPRSHPTR